MPSALPPPQLDAQWGWLVALLLIGIGALLLAWGNKYHRGALALVGAAIGALFGPMLAPHVGMTPLAGRIAGSMVLAVAAAIGAQIVWAVLAAGLALAAAAWALACNFASGASPGEAAGPANFPEWCLNVWTFVSGELARVWETQALVIILVLFVAAAVPLVIGLFKPKVATIVMTALLGAAGVVAGGLLASAQVNADWWAGALRQYSAPIAAFVALMTFGVIWQYRYELADTRRRDQDTDDQTDDDDRPPARGATQGKRRKRNPRGE